MSIPEYYQITERPDTRASALQLSILQTRYGFAARHSVGKIVFEAACGAGVGLGLLAKASHHVVGGDIDHRNCLAAHETYKGRADITVVRVDAQNAPFPDGYFDVVILFEAIYYLSDASEFLIECRRILKKPGGLLLISNVNCEWPEFNCSPFSTTYYSASQLRCLAESHGFRIELLGGFPDVKRGLLGSLVGIIKRLAVTFRLIPKTMKGKEWLKGIFYGRLRPIPQDLTTASIAEEPLCPLGLTDDVRVFRMLYAVCHRD